MFVLLSVAVVVVIAETYLRGTIEAEIAKDLKRYYNLEELPAVEINGSPFSWKILTGRFDSISATMTHLDTSQFASGQDRFATPLRIASMEVTLDGIHFSALGVLGGQKAFSADSGTLAAHVTEADLNVFMKSSGVKASFTILDSEVRVSATLTGQGQTFSVTGSGNFAYVDGTLVFEPVSVRGEGVSEQVAINAVRVVRPMPSIGGVRPTAVETAAGELILRADVNSFTFEPVGGEVGPEPVATPGDSLTPTVSPSPVASPSPTMVSPTPTKKSPTPTRSTTKSASPTRRN